MAGRDTNTKSRLSQYARYFVKIFSISVSSSLASNLFASASVTPYMASTGTSSKSKTSRNSASFLSTTPWCTGRKSRPFHGRHRRTSVPVAAGRGRTSVHKQDVPNRRRRVLRRLDDRFFHDSRFFNLNQVMTRLFVKQFPAPRPSARRRPWWKRIAVETSTTDAPSTAKVVFSVRRFHTPASLPESAQILRRQSASPSQCLRKHNGVDPTFELDGVGADVFSTPYKPRAALASLSPCSANLVMARISDARPP